MQGFVVCTVLASRLTAASALITIVQGDEAILEISSAAALPVIVQVTTSRGVPLVGAMVTFRTPEAGPGARFGNSGSLTVVTDSGGFAIGHGMKPNSVAGMWTLEVQAEGPEWRAMERVAQTNAIGLGVEAEGPMVTSLDLVVGGGGLLALAGVILVYARIRREPMAMRPVRVEGRALPAGPAQTAVAT